MSDRLRADRLNEEPPIFRGCSSSELVVIVVGAAAFWLPVSVLIGFMLGGGIMGVGIGAVMILATAFVVATVFQRVKRGRPTGYYQQRVAIAAHRVGLRKAPCVLRSGTWDIGRRL